MTIDTNVAPITPDSEVLQGCIKVPVFKIASGEYSGTASGVDEIVECCHAFNGWGRDWT